jgi:hypothetical protein
MQQNWSLVLVIWGEAYPDAHVNALVASARRHSDSLSHVVVVTDRARPALGADIEQKPFPEFFRDPLFFRPGYPAKLSLFHREIVPPATKCVYLDLDTIVLGDLGQIAALVRDPDDILMLPPGNLIGFGRLRRLVSRVTRRRRIALGNSSIMVFHSASKFDLCAAYEARFHAQPHGIEMRIDDRFISWFAQDRLRAIPNHLAVMFRREFLSRSSLLLRLRARLPWVIARRRGLVAITFNGAEHKPVQFADMPEGTKLVDSKGRCGVWREPEMYPLRDAIACAAKSLATDRDVSN